MRARWILGWLAVLGVFGGASACAQGSSLTGGGDGDGGSGASTTTTTTPTETTTTTQTGTTTTTNNCSEDPCKLVAPQCGCPAGEQCTLADLDGSRTCKVEGTTAVGGVCTTETCEAGSICVSVAPPVSTCSKFCASDADCEAPGGLCLITLNDGVGGEVPNLTLCTDNCDPTTNAGCAQGTECQIGLENGGLERFLTLCSSVGPGVYSDPCTDNTDCAPTYACTGDLGGGPVCLQWCKVGQGGCLNGLICSPFDPILEIGSVEYGACI